MKLVDQVAGGIGATLVFAGVAFCSAAFLGVFCKITYLMFAWGWGLW